MVSMKILVAIILTELQRFESRAHVRKTYYMPQVQTGKCEGEKFAGSGTFYTVEG